jgi:hypothetical protein
MECYKIRAYQRPLVTLSQPLVMILETLNIGINIFQFKRLNVLNDEV